MTPPWTPELPVTAAVVRAVLHAWRPERSVVGLRRIGVGWDHAVWQCGDVVVRCPHQRGSLTLAAGRSGALSWLAGRLPVPIPKPLFVAPPVGGHPGQCVVYQGIVGEMPAACGLTLDDRHRAAPLLGRALGVLHGLSLEDARKQGLQERWLPQDELRLRTTNGQLRATQLANTRWAALSRRAVQGMEPPPQQGGERAVTHGDLHPGQLLFGDQGQLTGIIDWDELRIGDPAMDLALVYALLPAASRGAFWAAYGTPWCEDRARHVALSVSLAILAQAAATDEVALAEEAARSVGFALEG